MFTMVAFSESVDNAGVMTPITAVVDQHVTVQDDFIYIPKFANRFLGAKAMCGASVTHVRLRAPSLARVNPIEISPKTLGIINVANECIDMRQYGQIALDEDEGLSCEHDGNPAAAEQTSVLVFLSDGKVDPVGGEIRSVRGSITLALVAGAFTYSEITLVDELPVGNYSLVGLRADIAVALAVRCVFKGTQTFRPATPCELALGSQQHWGIFRHGNLGVWGDFDSRNIFGIEALGNAAVASATYQIVMDLIKK